MHRDTPTPALTVLLASLLVACSGSSSPSAPSAPSRVNEPTAPATPAVITGRVTATVTGETMAGLNVSVLGVTTQTSAEGHFQLNLPASLFGGSALANIQGPAIVERNLWLFARSHETALDVISTAQGFDLVFYRKFVRDGLNNLPTGLRTIQRWTTAPRVYVRTVNDAGVAIDSTTLNTVTSALQDEASAWTGGRFGLAAIEAGPDTREGVAGWITVKWPAVAEEDICGRAQVAVSGGWIELGYLNPRCGCRGSKMTPGIVRHELGHALGFWHSDDPNDLMYSRVGECDQRPSARERFHAAVAYSRPVGNSDPDTDPSTVIARHEPPIVVVN